MDEIQDNLENDKKIEKLPGQIRYDEILSSQKNVLEDNTLKSSKHSDQLGIFDVLSEQLQNKKQDTKNDGVKMNSTDEIEDNNSIDESTTDNVTDKTNMDSGSDDGYIHKTLNDVLHDSMIPYTEHVVMDRALPRVEDGLKPVQRRILYSMMELGVQPDKPFRKSARIVGDCMGKYHPHGDSSVYDAMVRMSQSFLMSAPLIWGHGNFGSIDGDSAAAMRYTEAKLQPLAMELLRDLEKNTVKWSLNFDDTLKEPDILPGRFPNLLVNGAYGIAVGLATNIPPHNLAEVIEGAVALIDNPKITLAEMMKYIKAPDFPTGGIITSGEDLLNAYRTGKGRVLIRSKVHLETQGEKTDIVITEIPYQVNKAQLLQKIAELKSVGKNPLMDVADIRDESDRNGLRAVIKLKKEANVNAILEYLYKSTNLQVSFAINMVAIASGKPRLMGLLEILQYYVEYQREVIYNRTKFDLETAKDRAHIIEGILIAIKNIDEVIAIIKKSSTSAEAKTKLKIRFMLSEKQAQAILDMRLARLVNLEVNKLEEELKTLLALIKELTSILGSKKLQYEVVKKEMTEIRKKYGEPRRSKIVNCFESLVNDEDEKQYNKEMLIGITSDNCIKNIPLKNYSMAQKEITDNSQLCDIHKILLKTESDKKLLIFFSNGNCFKVSANKLPEQKWRDKGVSLKLLDANITTKDEIVSVLEIPTNLSELELNFYTKQGVIKKSKFEEYDINKAYFNAIKLKDGDKVLKVEVCDLSKNIVWVSSKGITLHMFNQDIPTQSRTSGGVIGINLDDGDQVMLCEQVNAEAEICVLTDYGFAKKVSLTEFEPMSRNRKGMRIINLSGNGTKICGALICDSNRTFACKTENGIYSIDTNRLPVEQRYTKGCQKITDVITQLFIYNY